jgi:CHAT domain-containing protein
MSGRRLRILALAIVISGVAAGAVYWREALSDVASGQFDRVLIARHAQTLTEELSRARVIEARVALGASYAPFHPQRGVAPSTGPTPAVEIAAARLQQISARRPTAESLSALGVAELLRGRIPEAVDALERARRLTPARVPTLIDLSAAYLARKEPGDEVRSFDTALQAAAARPSPEALFNAALAGEQLAGLASAKALWRDALSHEPAADWRRVASARLASLESIAPQAASAVQMRDTRGSAGLQTLANACAAVNDATAAHAIVRASEQARLFGVSSTDRYFADTLAWLIVRPARTPSTCHHAHATTFLAFDAARALYDTDQFAQTLKALNELMPTLRAEDSPLFVEAEFLAATSMYFTGQAARATTMLERVRHDADRRRYLGVLARIEWMRGFGFQDRNEFDRAWDAYQAALAAYLAVPDPSGAAAARSLLASLHDTLGEYTDGWREREAALHGFTQVDPTRTTYSVLTSAARAAIRDGLAHAGAKLAEAAQTEAAREGSATRLVETTVLRASAARQNEDRRGAERFLAEAREKLEALPPSDARNRIRARVLILDAELTSDRRAAIGPLTDAIDAYTRAGSRLLVARLLLARGRVHEGLGEDDRAKKDFEDGIDIFERARESLSSASQRVDYFEEAWGLFDSLAALHTRHQRFDAAFAAAERGRARELRAGLQRGPAPPQRLTAMIPAHTVVVYYVVVPDALLICALRQDTWSCEPHAIARDRLRELVGDFADTVKSRSADDRTREWAAIAAYDVLIRPIERFIKTHDRLLIAPDARLAGTPFAALLRRESSRYLIEDHAIAILPSLSIADGRPAASWEAPADALVIRGSAAPGSSVPGAPLLPALPEAKREASEIAAIYPRSLLIDGDDASARGLWQELPRHPVMHFAGHAVVNADAPGFSRLIVRAHPTSGADGTLYAHQLEQLDFSGVRLVVLAACQTAAGRTYQSEGVLSLARTFLSRGAETVLATLWDIDDRTARELFRAVHVNVREGSDPIEAVQRAQLAMLEKNRGRARPYEWANIILAVRVLR